VFLNLGNNNIEIGEQVEEFYSFLAVTTDNYSTKKNNKHEKKRNIKKWIDKNMYIIFFY